MTIKPSGLYSYSVFCSLYLYLDCEWEAQVLTLMFELFLFLILSALLYVISELYCEVQ